MRPEPVPPSAESPALRRVVLWIARRCLGWFYRDVRVVRAEQIPATGAVLLIGNHPNDLPDVLLGYLTTPRPLRYIATISAARSWISARTYAALGVVPVARVRDVRAMRADGVDAVAVNRAANDAVHLALAEGAVVGVFPEGGVHVGPSLGSFRTGVASMVLKYVDADAKNDVKVVPFGVQYEAPHTPGSDVVVVVGAPFGVREAMAAELDGERGAAALSRRFRRAVEGVTRNAPTWEAAADRDRLVAAVAAVSAEDPLAVAPALVPDAERVAVSDDPADVRLRTDAAVLADAVARAGGVGTSAMDMARLCGALGVGRASTSAVLDVATGRMWLGAPVALLGAALHAPVWRGIWWWARRSASGPAEWALKSFIPGLYVMVGWYLLLAVVGAAACRALGWSAWWAVLLVVVAPRCGDSAMRWYAAWRAWRLVRRVRGWPAAQQQVLREAADRVRRAV